MKSRAFIPLALGLVLGLVALKLGVDAIRRAQGGQTTGPEIEAVVATTDIGPTMRISADAVVVKRTKRTPLLPADAFSKIQDVVGRVTNITIPAGTPISPSLLAPEGTVPGLRVKIEEGYRAVSVKIDEVTGVAFQIPPGSFVDVLVVMDIQRGRAKETMSRVILQNVQVAAVGQLRGDPNNEDDATHANSVTLLLKAEDVPKLHLAQIKGRITLALRGGEDELLTAESNTLESELLGQKPENKTESESASAALSPAVPSAIVSSMLADARPVHPPFTTTVINGPLGAEASGQILRVTYASADSMEVVEVGKGRTTGDSSSMRFGVGEQQRQASSRQLFSDRDRSLRRRGARGDVADRDDDGDTDKETGE